MMDRRWIAALAVPMLLAGALGGGARAQTALLGPSIAASPVAPAVASPGASPAEIDALVTTLEDPVARAKLIEQLRVLSAAQQTAGEPAADAAGLIERFLAEISAGISAVGDDVGASTLR